MADDSLLGPSRQKRPRSDSEEEPFNNSDSEWSGAEDMADEVTEYDHVNNNQHDNTDFSQNVNADKQPIDIHTMGRKTTSAQFTGTQELKVPFPGEGRPIDFFNLFADDVFYDMLLTETTRYAEYVFLHDPQGPHSRISRWKCVDEKEMVVFLGISFLMGIIQLRRLCDYWRTDGFYNLSVRNNTIGVQMVSTIYQLETILYSKCSKTRNSS
ncbi:Transposase IS4 [Popillia japonica]|uniref:Transposase IS4 n=1 Tax=Popillia japonica TaxID=7064 RepID=A0AAW1IBZ9_POPJA